MKEFLAFVRIEFYHIFRDRRTMLILLGMPVMQILLFGFAISTEVKDCRFMILDASGDTQVQRLVQRFDENPYFRFLGRLDSPKDMYEAFRRNQVDLVVVTGDRFQEHLVRNSEARIQLIADGTDPNTAHMMMNYARSLVLAELQSVSEDGAALAVQTHLLYNPQMKSAYNFVPGVMGLILMLICTMMTSISIVREKETGTMEVLLVSPIRPIFIIIAKAVPYFLLSCVNLITILFLSVFVLHVPIAGSIFLLFAVSMLLIVVALSLGLLVSTLVHTQVAAMIISGMVMMMPVMLLSGIIFPIESMPTFLQGVSHFIPAKWYIQAIKKVMIEGSGFTAIVSEVSILSAMAVFLLSVSLFKFKYRLE